MRLVRCTIGLALLVGACASPGQIRANAASHAAHARACEARGDYRCAYDQWEAARKQYRKAEARAAERYPM